MNRNFAFTVLYTVQSSVVAQSKYTPPLVKRPLCSQSHEVCTPVPPSCQRSPGGTERVSSSALGSSWPQWWGTRSEPEWSDGGKDMSSVDLYVPTMHWFVSSNLFPKNISELFQNIFKASFQQDFFFNFQHWTTQWIIQPQCKLQLVMEFHKVLCLAQYYSLERCFPWEILLESSNSFSLLFGWHNNIFKKFCKIHKQLSFCDDSKFLTALAVQPLLWTVLYK